MPGRVLCPSVVSIPSPPIPKILSKAILNGSTLHHSFRRHYPQLLADGINPLDCAGKIHIVASAALKAFQTVVYHTLLESWITIV